MDSIIIKHYDLKNHKSSSVVACPVKCLSYKQIKLDKNRPLLCVIFNSVQVDGNLSVPSVDVVYVSSSPHMEMAKQHWNKIDDVCLSKGPKHVQS